MAWALCRPLRRRARRWQIPPAPEILRAYPRRSLPAAPAPWYGMWVTGLLGCSTKAAEIIIGQRYRVRYSHIDEYTCSRELALKQTFGLKILPFLLAALFCISSPWTCLVQVEASVSSWAAAVSGDTSLIVTVLFLGSAAVVIFGGLRRISSWMEKIRSLYVHRLHFGRSGHHDHERRK